MRIPSACLRLGALLAVSAWLGLGVWEEADARAGGAGGGSSSSKSSGNSGSGSRSSGPSRSSGSSGSKSSGSGSSGSKSSGSKSSGSESSGSESSGSESSGSKSSGSKSSGSKSSGSGSSYRSSPSTKSNRGGDSSTSSRDPGSGGYYYDRSNSNSGLGSDFLSDLLRMVLVGALLISVMLMVLWMLRQNPPRWRWRWPWRKREPEPVWFPFPPGYPAHGLDEFLAANPDFDRGAFGLKVRTAFMEIQAAWMDQNISRVRRFISDGIYQRFTAQFRMMGLLEQHNVLDDIRIHDVRPVSYRTDGPYEVIDVWICATMSDSFVCKLDRSMNSKGNDPFAEYWSFLRKRGAGNAGVDLFSNKSCPSCGGDLPADMGELCRCTHCQVMVNSGEFDWVLAEITQEADYHPPHVPTPYLTADLAKGLAVLAVECPDFSQQLAEDKASNAFMQIMTAYATRQPASIRRFVTDELFAAISAKIQAHNFLFNRLYLNESVLRNAGRTGARHRLTVALAASAQRVGLLPDGKLLPFDREEQRMKFTLTLERDIAAVPEKGSLYQHQCAVCGGAVADTPDVMCQYCGTALNSTRHEWIVCGFEGN